MNHLTRNDFANALQVLARIEAHAGDVDTLARAVEPALVGYVACELAMLDVCELSTGHRQVLGLPNQWLGAYEIDDFARHCLDHLLVHHDGRERDSMTRRISDLVSRHDFQRSAQYGDCFRRIGLEYAIAISLISDRRTLVSVVLKRRGRDFDQRDRERLDLLRPHLAFLYRHAREVVARPHGDSAALDMALSPDPGAAGLTRRESTVMQWLACGKTDQEIAARLSISPRTVQKHLEHIYVKLGVETRTAAVMRVLAISNQTALREPPSSDSHDIGRAPAYQAGSTPTATGRSVRGDGFGNGGA